MMKKLILVLALMLFGSISFAEEIVIRIIIPDNNYQVDYNYTQPFIVDLSPKTQPYYNQYIAPNPYYLYHSTPVVVPGTLCWPNCY